MYSGPFTYLKKWLFPTHTTLVIIKFPANCGLPSFPINGYGQVYTDNTTVTMEGSRILLICSNDIIQHSIEEAHVIVCNPDGNWHPNPTNICLGTKTIVLYMHLDTIPWPCTLLTYVHYMYTYTHTYMLTSRLSLI